MKKINIFIVCTVLAFFTVSCEKFFDRAPEDELSSASFFRSEADLVLYTNGLINSGLPSASSITFGEDLYTDLCGTRESKEFYYPGKWNPGKQTGWEYKSWGFLRQVAYMYENMHQAKSSMPEEKYNHYEGVVRFWRAFATFNKVKDFSDCYYIDSVLSPADTSMLYGKRQSREYIMSKVKEDLIFACENCLESGQNIHTDGRIYINRYVALAMASRIFLYEGTYRKYHDVNPSTGRKWNTQYESAEDFLELAYKYAKELIDEVAFSLEPDYRKLFTSTTLCKNEVIWGRSFSEELSMKHDATFKYCSATSSKHYSPTKDYVMMFLKSDGKPANGNVSVTKEFENRDKRLTASVVGPGQKQTDASGKEIDFPLNFLWSRTGYLWLKWVTPVFMAMNTSDGGSLNCLPIIRYAEVLLNCAEAAEELGLMTPELWSSTIGKLRERAGVVSIYPESADYGEDQFLKSYYTDNRGKPVKLSNTLLEIRRERATELMLEGDSRYDDLMRWRMGHLIQRRYDNKGWRGIYLSKDEVKNGFVFNGTKFTVSINKGINSETNYVISNSEDGNTTLSNGDYGYLIYHYGIVWEDKMYTKPIPTTALNLNPELGQNSGWEWI